MPQLHKNSALTAHYFRYENNILKFTENIQRDLIFDWKSTSSSLNFKVLVTVPMLSTYSDGEPGE